MHAGMSYARLEAARRPPVALLRREPSRRAASSTAGSGRSRSRARGSVLGRGRRSAGRRARRAVSRSASPPAAVSTPTTPACRRRAIARPCAAARASISRPKTRPPTASPKATACASPRAAAPSRRPCASTRPAAGPGLHDPPLPRRGGHQRADHRCHRSQVGHRRVQGHARSASRRWRPRSARGTGADGSSISPVREPRSRSGTPIDVILGPPLPRAGRDAEAARGHRRPLLPADARPGRRRHLLLPVLHAVQARIGWISPGALNYICQRLDVPPAEAYGVASFYAMFSLTRSGRERRPRLRRHRLPVEGGERPLRRDAEAVGPAGGPGTSRRDLAPQPLPRPLRAGAGGLVSAAGERPREAAAREATAASLLSGPRATEARVGHEPSPARVRFAAVRRARLASPAPDRPRGSRRAWTTTARRVAIPPCAAPSSSGPAGVVREVIDSKLVGRGGAAFPTGRKWEAVAPGRGAPALPRLQRRRVRARHLQGPRPDGG